MYGKNMTGEDIVRMPPHIRKLPVDILIMSNRQLLDTIAYYDDLSYFRMTPGQRKRARQIREYGTWTGAFL